MYIWYFVIISPCKRVEPFIGTNLSPLHPRTLCAKFGWNWSCGSWEEDFKILSMYFCYFIIISPSKRAGPFILTMHCTKFGWNWLSGSGEEDENVKIVQRQRRRQRQQQRQRRWTTDKLWLEKLTWAIGSGELKRRKRLYPTKNEKTHIYQWWRLLLKLDEKSIQIALFIDLIPNWGDILTSYMNVFNSLLIWSNLCILYRQVYQEEKNKTRNSEWIISTFKMKLRYFIIIFFHKKEKKERGFIRRRIKEIYLPVMEVSAVVRWKELTNCNVYRFDSKMGEIYSKITWAFLIAYW